RPLEARLLWIEPHPPAAGEPQIIVALDHCILDAEEVHRIRDAIHAATAIGRDNILITLTHTHGAGWMSRTRSHLPGGDLIGPYRDGLGPLIAEIAREAQSRVRAATFVYGTGHCNLAAHRDYFDAERKRYVCGFNPEGPADDTLLVGRLADESGSGL